MPKKPTVKTKRGKVVKAWVALRPSDDKLVGVALHLDELLDYDKVKMCTISYTPSQRTKKRT